MVSDLVVKCQGAYFLGKAWLSSLKNSLAPQVVPRSQVYVFCLWAQQLLLLADIEVLLLFPEEKMLSGDQVSISPFEASEKFAW